MLRRRGLYRAVGRPAGGQPAADKLWASLKGESGRAVTRIPHIAIGQRDPGGTVTASADKAQAPWVPSGPWHVAGYSCRLVRPRPSPQKDRGPACHVAETQALDTGRYCHQLQKRNAAAGKLSLTQATRPERLSQTPDTEAPGPGAGKQLADDLTRPQDKPAKQKQWLPQKE